MAAKRDQRRYLPLLWIMLGVLLLSAGIYFLPPDLSERLIRENGLIENATAVLYGLGAAAAWALYYFGIWSRGRSGALVFCIFLMRELDFHSRFTDASVLKVKFLFYPEVPWGQKVVAGPFLIFFGVAFARFVYLNWRPFWRDVRRRRPFANSVLAALVFLLFAKWIDNYKNKLHPYLKGVVQDNIDHLLAILEETIEMGCAALFLLALWQWRKSVANGKFLSAEESPLRVAGETGAPKEEA